MPSRKPLGRRILSNLGRKWVQVTISFLVFVLTLLGSYRLLVKAPPVTDAEKKKQLEEFKFMHCDKCMKELPFNKELVDKPAKGCSCKPGDGGFWVGTKESVKSGGDWQYQWFATAALVEGVLWMAVLWFLLARKDDTPDYFYVRCLHCRAILQFTPAEFDSLIECPNCEQPVRLPDEDEAMTSEDYQELHTDATLSQYESRLRASGYVFPDERPAPEGEPPAEQPVAGEPPATNTPDGPP